MASRARPLARGRAGPPLVVVLHGEVPPDAPPDEQDVLVEADHVGEALSRLGLASRTLPLGLAMDRAVDVLQALQPSLVFNLVESLRGDGRLCWMAPALLDHLGLPYTGSPTDAIYLSTTKLLTKALLKQHGLATPDWAPLEQVCAGDLPFEGPYIVKLVWEEASVGLTDASVVPDRATLLATARTHQARLGGPAFVERFIEGREINVAVVEEAGQPRVLPPSEILFEGFPAGKPHMVGYAAKWDTESFEYTHTPRTFTRRHDDGPLMEQVAHMARRTWQAMGLKGYARVDFRIDAHGAPWILEVNTNPCLSPDAGFLAAAAQAGLSSRDVVERIVAAALPQG